MQGGRGRENWFCWHFNPFLLVYRYLLNFTARTSGSWCGCSRAVPLNGYHTSFHVGLPRFKLLLCFLLFLMPLNTFICSVHTCASYQGHEFLTCRHREGELECETHDCYPHSQLREHLCGFSRIIYSSSTNNLKIAGTQCASPSPLNNLTIPL